MKIEDGFTVEAPIGKVWRFITDPDQVAPCVPGCQEVEVLGPTTYQAKVRVGLGPIKTTFIVAVELIEERPPEFLASVTRGEEGGKASTLTAQNELRLIALSESLTQVNYSSDVSIFGRLGKYGLGMMKKRAQTLGLEFAKAFAARVENSQGEAVAATERSAGGR